MILTVHCSPVLGSVGEQLVSKTTLTFVMWGFSTALWRFICICWICGVWYANDNRKSRDGWHRCRQARPWPLCGYGRNLRAHSSHTGTKAKPWPHWHDSIELFFSSMGLWSWAGVWRDELWVWMKSNIFWFIEGQIFQYLLACQNDFDSQWTDVECSLFKSCKLSASIRWKLWIAFVWAVSYANDQLLTKIHVEVEDI